MHLAFSYIVTFHYKHHYDIYLTKANRISIFLFIISHFYTKLIFQAISILSISSDKKFQIVATLLLDKEKEATNI